MTKRHLRVDVTIYTDRFPYTIEEPVYIAWTGCESRKDGGWELAETGSGQPSSQLSGIASWLADAIGVTLSVQDGPTDG